VYAHILIATDGSELSRHAIHAGVELARVARARATFVTCSVPFGELATDPLALRRRDQYEAGAQGAAHTHLEAALAVARAAGVAASGEHCYAEQPWRGILDTALARRCDVIAMAAHGPRSVAGELLGSETFKVLTHAQVPVLACRERSTPLRHVLIPTDGSERSERAIRDGVELAAAAGARVTLLACSEPFIFRDAESFLNDDRPEYEEHALSAARPALAYGESVARQHGVAAVAEHLFVSHPHAAIVHAASRLGCDLIVMASHGRRGVAALVPGSETLRVLAHSRVPVLVCR